jgi:hypothetical protein
MGLLDDLKKLIPDEEMLRRSKEELGRLKRQLEEKVTGKQKKPVPPRGGKKDRAPDQKQINEFKKLIEQIQKEQRKKQGELDPPRRKGQAPGQRLGTQPSRKGGRRGGPGKERSREKDKPLGRATPGGTDAQQNLMKKQFASTSRKPRARST